MKKSILVLSLVVFWAGYVAISATQYYINISHLTDRFFQQQKHNTDFVIEFIEGLIIKDNLDYAVERLKQARDNGMMDFYILQKKDKVVTFYNGKDSADDMNVDYVNFNRFIETADVTFKTVKIYDYRLTVGFVFSKQRAFLRNAWDQKNIIIPDMILVTSFLGIMLFFVLKDILDLSRLLTSHDRSKVNKLKSISKEGEALLKAATSYENHQRNLKHEKDFFAASITPAILHELEAKTPVPSSFDSTMVRVDLNGYTQLYMEKKDEYVTGILNKYFVAAREIIERYDGLVYQYVGDEVVFHFKAPRAQAEPVAAACVRSLFELAEDIEKNLPPEAGHYFKLKASLASGLIRFIRLDTGFALTGLPLIESARLLGQNDDKARNSLALYESSKNFVSKLCKLSEPKESHLKGFAEPVLVCTVTEFKPQTTILEKDQADQCKYFRSDENLVALMTYLETLVQQQSEDLFFTVFKDLKSMRARLISLEVEAAFCRFLESTYRKSHDQAVNPKILSAAVSLTQNLVPSDQTSDKLTEILKLYLQFSNARVQANALSVLGESSGNVRFLKKFIHATDNRLSADALVVSGKQVVDKELVQRIQELLQSPDKVYQASGRYVIMTLIEHYKTKDVVYYNTSPHLKKLEELLGKAA